MLHFCAAYAWLAHAVLVHTQIEVRGNIGGNLTYELDQTELPGTSALELWIDRAAKRNLGFRFIYSGMKLESVEETSEELAYARQLTRWYPNTVIGFDLVGQEDQGVKL